MQSCVQGPLSNKKKRRLEPCVSAQAACSETVVACSHERTPVCAFLISSDRAAVARHGLSALFIPVAAGPPPRGYIAPRPNQLFLPTSPTLHLPACLSTFLLRCQATAARPQRRRRLISRPTRSASATSLINCGRMGWTASSTCQRSSSSAASLPVSTLQEVRSGRLTLVLTNTGKSSVLEALSQVSKGPGRHGTGL